MKPIALAALATALAASTLANHTGQSLEQPSESGDVDFKDFVKDSPPQCAQPGFGCLFLGPGLKISGDAKPVADKVVTSSNAGTGQPESSGTGPEKQPKAPLVEHVYAFKRPSLIGFVSVDVSGDGQDHADGANGDGDKDATETNGGAAIFQFLASPSPGPDMTSGQPKFDLTFKHFGPPKANSVGVPPVHTAAQQATNLCAYGTLRGKIVDHDSTDTDGKSGNGSEESGIIKPANVPLDVHPRVVKPNFSLPSVPGLEAPPSSASPDALSNNCTAAIDAGSHIYLWVEDALASSASEGDSDSQAAKLPAMKHMMRRTASSKQVTFARLR